MAILIVVETTALTLKGTLDGPLWFDVLSAGSLIPAILLGGELFKRLNHTPAVTATN